MSVRFTFLKKFETDFSAVKLPTNGLSFGMPSIPGKRDSFGKPLSSANSLKDQLHTLMEEEEEEEEEIEEKFAGTVLPVDEHNRESSPKPLVSDHHHERRRTKAYGICKFNSVRLLFYGD